MSTKFNGVVPGAIRAYSKTVSNILGILQSSQASDKPFCKNFNYSVNSTEKVVTFYITAEQTFFDAIAGNKNNLLPERTPLNITVYLKDCPQGFYLSHTSGSCVCDPVLDAGIVQCNINNQSIMRPANSWIGFVTTDGVMFHPSCPRGYCLPQDVSITRNTSDSQCQPHRTGLLCGECEEGYSLTLGYGQCDECINTYLLLILPLAVAGLLLVAILFVLNLTVTDGSINGLIFYANVIGMKQNVLFSGETSYLTTFLAWLNLDLGINMCLL